MGHTAGNAMVRGAVLAAGLEHRALIRNQGARSSFLIVAAFLRKTAHTFAHAALIAGLTAAEPAFAGDASFGHVSCKGEPNEIRVTIKGVKKSTGLMTAELFRNDPAGFLNKKGRLFRVRYAAHAPETQFCLTAPEPGQWAVVVYHDENANQKFDKGALGLPVEPYGVSRNPKIRLGPPPIEDALFEVAESGASVEIKLKG